MKFDEYYQKQGDRGKDFGIGFGISLVVIIGGAFLLAFLANLITNSNFYPIITFGGLGLLMLTGIGMLLFHPRKFIGIGMLGPFALGLILFGSCLFMIRGRF